MLRFGILATLIWHYTVDAVLIGTFLIASQSWYFRLSGLLVAGAVLFPLALSIYRYRRNGGFLGDTGLTNAALLPPVEPAPSGEAPSTAEVLAAPEPLWPRRYLYIAAAVALALGLVLSPHRYGDFIRVRLDRNAALAIASRALPRKASMPRNGAASPSCAQTSTPPTSNISVVAADRTKPSVSSPNAPCMASGR